MNAKALLEQKEEGVSRRLRAFELQTKGIPRQGYDIVDEAGNKHRSCNFRYNEP